MPIQIDMDLASRYQGDFYQYNGKWDKLRQSRVIESILLRIPLPSFYFDGVDDSKWKVIDGFYRLSVLEDFIVNKSLKLTGLEYLTDFNGLKIDELPNNMVRRIEETKIIAHIIRSGTPDEVRGSVLERVNYSKVFKSFYSLL